MATQIKTSALAVYLAHQIFQGKLDYNAVVKKYPRYKTIIDETLADLNVIPMSAEEDIEE